MVRAGFAVPLVFGCLAFSQDLSITVRTFNQYKVQPEILRNAEAEAAYLFSTAALRIVWIDCSKAGKCDHELASNEFAVLIRNSPPAAKHASKRDLLGKALVVPEGRSTYAMVYYDAVQAAAKRQGVITESDLLGYVMGHELAHLLGANHNLDTIMKGSVVPRDMDALCRRQRRFNRDEGDRIRSEVLARLRPLLREWPTGLTQ